MKIEINDVIFIKDLFEKTLRDIGSIRFYTYKSHSWNCQDFVINILNSNSLLNNQLKEFILQNTEYLFNKLGYLKYISDKLTDTASILDKVYHGGKIIDYRIQSILFNKKKMNLDECKKWILDKKLKIKKIDETKNYYRFRQLGNQYIKSKGYNDYNTIDIDKDIKMIIVYKN